MRIAPTKTTLAALAILACALSSCALDAKKIEKNITDKLEGEGLDIASVECPSGKTIKKDDTFSCKGKEKDGEKFTIDVTQKGNGDITWEMKEKYADMEKIEKTLAKRKGSKVDLDCGAKAVIIVKGRKVDCTVKSGSEKTKIRVVFNDDQGDDVDIEDR